MSSSCAGSAGSSLSSEHVPIFRFVVVSSLLIGVYICLGSIWGRLFEKQNGRFLNRDDKEVTYGTAVLGLMMVLAYVMLYLYFSSIKNITKHFILLKKKKKKIQDTTTTVVSSDHNILSNSQPQ